MSMFVESFDHYNGLAAGGGLLSRWTISDAALSARQAMVTGRHGTGQAFSAGAGSSGTIHQTNCLLADRKGNNFSVTNFRMHVALAPKSTTASGSECGFGLCANNNQIQLALQWLSNSWRLVRWGGVAGGSPAAVLYTSAAIYTNPNEFHSFSLKGNIHASTGAVDLAIDGVQVFTGSSLNTGTGTIDRVAFAQGNADAGAGVIADDLVVENTNSAYLPDLRIDPLPPNSDGGTLNWVPSTGSDHYAVVDEMPMNTTDYLQGSTVGDIDLLGLPNLASTPNSILGVNLVGFANKSDVTARSWNLGVQSGATSSNGSDEALGTSVEYFHRLLETDPNTAAAWAAAGVNALQLRPRVAV